uniref:Uncharacterized protein n=1 Tax=Haptolina brevifila TaxID=156173 RepID=A0A7S2GN74_9EUKA|mmetsp:Transcript_43667/g.87402  ORF Transcript_43667/g.87402 Transcript_43667/m.87402 type:complete len:174 (+) Transcript_43667:398-919(+)
MLGRCWVDARPSSTGRLCCVHAGDQTEEDCSLGAHDGSQHLPTRRFKNQRLGVVPSRSYLCNRCWQTANQVGKGGRRIELHESGVGAVMAQAQAPMHTAEPLMPTSCTEPLTVHTLTQDRANRPSGRAKSGRPSQRAAVEERATTYGRTLPAGEINRVIPPSRSWEAGIQIQP